MTTDSVSLENLVKTFLKTGENYMVDVGINRSHNEFIMVSFHSRLLSANKSLTASKSSGMRWSEINSNKNHDIAIAMASSLADPVLGLNILQG